ncbi:MAG TPA: GNAT family N-acetyltransferase [Pyrinomonadaceae bacterium]|nr:GNAT family N-acetyltransferase [Pyrinomonadaceae bacterium]
MKENVMIKTERLKLIPCELEHFEAMLRDERELAGMLGVSPAEDWLGFEAARDAMSYSYEYLKAHPEALGWWTYLFIHGADNALIGLGGFKGEADADGIVEIGYSLAPGYRGQGLATEASRGMIAYAFSHAHVREVIAHTLPEKNPSTRVLERVGMKRDGVGQDPDEGEVWRWSLKRDEYQES